MNSRFDLLVDLFEDMDPPFIDELYLNLFLSETDIGKTISCFKTEKVLRKLKELAFGNLMEAKNIALSARTLLDGDKWRKDETVTLFLLASTLTVKDSERPFELRQLWEEYARYCKGENRDLCNLPSTDVVRPNKNHRFFMLLEKAMYAKVDSKHSEQYNKMGLVHPDLHDFAIPCNTNIQMEMQRFTTDLRISGERRTESDRTKRQEAIYQFNEKSLARHFRIIQWEILIRDIEEETLKTSKDIHYEIGTIEREVFGSITSEFHLELARYSRQLTYDDDLIRYKKECTSSTTNVTAHGDKEDKSLKDKLNMFREMLPHVIRYNSTTFRDIVETFSILSDKRLPFIIIKDAELTFFTILWLFRLKPESELIQWFTSFSIGELTKNSLPLDFNYDLQGSVWKDIDPIGFFHATGLFIPSPSGSNRLIPSRRMKKFALWMSEHLAGRVQTYLIATLDKIGLSRIEEVYSQEHLLMFAKQLPIKLLSNYSKEEKEFIINMISILINKEQMDRLIKYLEICSFPASGAVACKDVAAMFLNFMEYFRPLISAEVQDVKSHHRYFGLNDQVINRLCRSVFLPCDFLFRSNQMFDVDLLVIGLHFTPTVWLNNELAPMILSFASIAGGLDETDCLCPITDNNCEEKSINEGISIYWQILSEMSSDITSEQIRLKAMKAGIRSGMDLLLHRLPKDLAALDGEISMVIKELSNLRENHPEISSEIPTLEYPDSLSVMLMRTKAETSKQLYELPQSCANILYNSWTVDTINEFVSRVVWPQAQSLVQLDSIVNGKLTLKPLDTEKFKRPELIIPEQIMLRNANGIYPLLLAILRNAYKLSLIGDLLQPDNLIQPKQPKVIIQHIRSITNGEEVVIVRVKSTGPDDQASISTYHMQKDLEDAISPYRGLTGNWKINTQDNNLHSWYDTTEALWISEVQSCEEVTAG